VNLDHYKSLVFDCDGVIFDSNAVRARAFYNAALPYGKQHAESLAAYHIVHGGVSRYVKFEAFLRDMVGIPVTEQAMQSLLFNFTTEVRIGLMQCEQAAGLAMLREKTPNARWMVVSGADQEELRVILAQRGIAHWFDAGIYGSPSNKETILKRELENGSLHKSALFIGDSRYDHEAAIGAGLDFVFASRWTDFQGWEDYCATNHVTVIETLAHLIEN
jgi:phosphoglycolate phosphatase-like HAD superfamily hydrolase